MQPCQVFRVIPHTQVAYKEVLYLNQADADANDTGSAVYVIDNVDVTGGSGSVTVGNIEALGSANIIIGQTAGNAIVSVSGDVTTSESGVFTIGNDKITTAKVLNEAITEPKLSAVLQSKLNIARGSIGGLTTSIGTDTEHDIDVAVGQCADSTGNFYMSLTSLTTTAIDIAIGTGNGGFPLAAIPAGVQANTWYYLGIVAEADGSNPQLGFDTDLTFTNVLSDWSAQGIPDYTLYRRIAAVKTNGSSNLLGYIQSGDKFYWDAQVQETTTIATSLTSIATQVPPDFETIAMMHSYMSQNPTGSGIQATLKVASSASGTEYIVNSLYKDATSGDKSSSGANFEVITSDVASAKGIKVHILRL